MAQRGETAATMLPIAAPWWTEALAVIGSSRQSRTTQQLPSLRNTSLGHTLKIA